MTENRKSVPRKKRRPMFNFIINTVDKVFSQIYDGEPVKNHRRHRADSVEHILEEEVLFCKNNVCVHTVNIGEDNREKHNPGYMSLKKIYTVDSEVSDLILSWVPNSLLSVGSTEAADVFDKADNDIKDENVISDCKGETSNDCKTFSVSDVVQGEGKLKNQEENFCATHNRPVDSSPSRSCLDFETPLGDVFTVNLINMKTIKLFYTEKDKDLGQFVIGSPESEYKVFHFHTVGLVKVAEIFNHWKGCTIDPNLDRDEMGQQVYYILTEETRVGENGRDLHPEENRYRPMNMLSWQSCVNQLGQIEDAFNFRKHVFFGGLSQEVRPDAWKFLLYLYPMHSTEREREAIVQQRTMEYEEIHNKRLALSGEAYEHFWKRVQFTVDKDVVRTDRSHPYYAGQDNPNIQKMRNILLNYAIYNPNMGYTQGMSDLVAPVLATLHSEVESFWCFVGLMEFSMFATTPTDDSMEKSLGFLRELLRIMLPEFYMHCLCHDYDLSLLFAHRWLVLCFKREFLAHEVLKLWETCWSRYQTDYFHIFVCVALVSLYGNICLEKNMESDEVLQYFTDMAMKFDGSAVLREARVILYKFRQMNRIPCSLRGLISNKGVWDGGISPEVECASNHQRCCFEYKNKPSRSNKDVVNSVEKVVTETELSAEANVEMKVENANPDVFVEPPIMVMSEHQRLAVSDSTDCPNLSFHESSTSLEANHLKENSTHDPDTHEGCDVEDEQTVKVSNDIDGVELNIPISEKIDKATDDISHLTLDNKFMSDDKFSNANIY